MYTYMLPYVCIETRNHPDAQCYLTSQIFPGVLIAKTDVFYRFISIFKSEGIKEKTFKYLYLNLILKILFLHENQDKTNKKLKIGQEQFILNEKASKTICKDLRKVNNIVACGDKARK